MTILAAVHDKGETWIGADQRASFGNHVFDHTPKWIFGSKFALGIAGWSRLYSLMCNMDFVHIAPVDIAGYMKSAIENDGWKKSEQSGGPGSYDFGAIIAYKDCIFAVSCDFGLTTVPEGQMWITGSGSSYGYGAYHALRHKIVDDNHQLVRSVIEAACAYDRSCGGEPMVGKL